MLSSIEFALASSVRSLAISTINQLMSVQIFRPELGALILESIAGDFWFIWGCIDCFSVLHGVLAPCNNIVGPLSSLTLALSAILEVSRNGSSEVVVWVMGRLDTADSCPLVSCFGSEEWFIVDFAGGCHGVSRGKISIITELAQTFRLSFPKF